MIPIGAGLHEPPIPSFIKRLQKYSYRILTLHLLSIPDWLLRSQTEVDEIVGRSEAFHCVRPYHKQNIAKLCIAYLGRDRVCLRD